MDFEFVKKDLKSLSKNVRCYILKDYFKLGSANDIDILCRSRDRLKLIRKLSKLDYQTYNTFGRAIFFHKYYNNQLVRLHFHFNRMFDFLRYSDVYRKNGVKKGLNFVPKEYLLLSDITKLKTRSNKDKYDSRISQTLKDIKISQICNILNLVFTEESIKSFKKNKSYEKLQFRRKHLVSRYLSKYVFDKLATIPLIISKLFCPSDFVAIIGTDGSGKTTTVRNLKDYLKKYKFKVHIDYGGRYKFRCLFFLNYFAKSMVAKKVKKGSDKNIVRYEKNYLVYLVPIIYYFEYLLRYFIFTFMYRRLYNFVIIDRHFLDVIISPNTNTKFSKILYYFLPKPNKVIFIYNDIDVVVKRRADHPREDLIRQLKEYNSIQSLFTKKIKTVSFDQTIQDISDELFNN